MMRAALDSERLRDWAIAIALASLFSFTGLGNHPLLANDEPRVAGIAWEMQHTGHWWVPYLADRPFLEQPPLFYALLGACIERFGASEGVARLPGAIASALTALLVFALARRVADRSAGLPALLALVGVAGFFSYSHRVLVDPLLMLFVTLGYFAYVRAAWGNPHGAPDRDGGGRVAPGWLVAVYLAAALAFWVKGLVGVAAIGGPLAVDVLVGRRWRVLFSPAHLAGVPLLFAACAAWPLVLNHAEGEAAARTFLVNNVWYRMAPGAGGSEYIGGHQHPLWFYLPKVPEQLGWIAAFVPAAAAWLWRGALPPGWRLPALRFLACVFPIGVLLLSFPGTKRGLYLLPFEPPIAVAIGAWIAAAASADPHRSRFEVAVNAGCAHLVRAAQRPLARLGVAGRRIAGDLRDDLARATAGPCRAPLRVAAIAFALGIVWNIGVLRFTGQDRNLETMAREVGERVGDDRLFTLVGEGAVGALLFYTGRIPIDGRPVDGLARQLEQSGARYLLTTAGQRDLVADELGGAAPLQSWVVDRNEYLLYAIPGRDASLHPPRARTPALD
jgi:4-amino-4-deoxy-L-arabinose transferase-like glycosyltransferase